MELDFKELNMRWDYYELKRMEEYREKHVTHKAIYSDGSYELIFKWEINQYKSNCVIISII